MSYFLFYHALITILCICSSEHNFKQPDFSIKSLNNAYVVSPTKPTTQAEKRKPKFFKFDLSDDACTQPQASRFYSVKNIPLEEQENFHNIEVYNKRKYSPQPSVRSSSSSNNSLLRNENESFRSIDEVETNQHRLKNFLSQFKNETNRKRPTSVSQPISNKFNRFMGDIENYEPTPSCSKWNEYLPPTDNNSYVYRSPSPKRTNKNVFTFNSPPIETPKSLANFEELNLVQRRPIYTREDPCLSVANQNQYPYQFVPTTPPHRQLVARQDTPFINLVEDSLEPCRPIMPREPTFSQPIPCMSHQQYIPLPTMHYFPSSAPETSHCGCCHGTVYHNRYLTERGQYVPNTQLPYEKDNEYYLSYFKF